MKTLLGRESDAGASAGSDAASHSFDLLVIQIPCYNEEESLPATLAELPRQVTGFRRVEWLVVNDGSKDRTVEVARVHGVDHIVDLPVNKGLAHGFMTGLAHALAVGADCVVNTDADNQYDARDIEALVRPIVERRAEFVIGDRPIVSIEHFSRAKRLLQRLGSWVVRQVSRTDVRDAPSGFRAISREAALRINIFDGYTYTLESIIQAGRSNMRIVSVPIRVNGETRPSRLVRSIPDYVGRSMGAMARTYFIYKPGRTLFLAGLIPALLGALLMTRWIWLFLEGTERTHLPSLVAAAMLILIAAMLWVAALVAQLLGVQRRLMEDIQLRLRRQEVAQGRMPYAAGHWRNQAPARPEAPTTHGD